MITLFAALLPGLLKIGDKMIVNEDKKQEFAFKVQEMFFKQMETLLNTKTYPWVDALVKLAYASEQIVKGLFRPIVSAGVMIYGLVNPDLLKSLHELGVVGDAGIVGIFGAFPAWMKSRHDDKKQKAESKVIDFDDDY